ncbi:Colorectal mutant cancer protein [Echinococcus granulosus]|uniref:Colorectal mutant cancer protein n=1 Tax=Echinococcus granulosus TaxID=6210 RepID=W6UWX2_ECHGR|nr:Colorectal mutant cancer protein [Echinococcus granulosus]EUB57984.1 Colorectal mutant cancer protein [Echinococcus granulosus]
MTRLLNSRASHHFSTSLPPPFRSPLRDVAIGCSNIGVCGGGVSGGLFPSYGAKKLSPHILLMLTLFSARQTIVQEPWIAGSVRTVSSVQSDTAAAARLPDLTSPATSASSILTEVRTQGKPVMGLRQHIQTRKPRILSQAQLSQSCSGVGVNGNRPQRDSTQSPQISQPISEFSLNFEATEQAGRLSKASFACDDRVGQLQYPTSTVRKGIFDCADQMCATIRQWFFGCSVLSGEASTTPTATSPLASVLRAFDPESDQIRVRAQPHSSAWSERTSSVPHSCRSGDNNRGSETATAALGGTGGDEAEPQWVRYCVSCCLGATDTGGGGGISPSVGVAQTLLTGLAGAAPYPRLADVARCSLLACEQREALCARQDAEIAVLEASLAEAKATGNQLHCRLSQIEASWGAANRAAELADMALETSGVLVHLYSSELALLLHKQPHTERRPKSRKSLQDRSFGRHSLSRSAFTSSSTSTSSSSSSCSSSSGDEPQRSCKASSASVVPASCHHVASVKKSIGRQIQPPAATSDSGSNVYALYAMNEKSSDEALHLSIPTWIPPHAVHQTELTALHLLGRFASTSEPFLKPESLNSTIVEDFGHSTTNGNRSTATGTESGLGAESGGSSSGMGAHGVYTNAWGIATRPAASTRHAFKSGGGGDCGWQTPDSGADSFSTNDHTASTAATKATASLAVIAGVPNTHTCASCSSNSSSSSAAAGAVVINSGVGAGVSDATAVLHDVNVWTRVKEMRLRHILDQIIWERMLVRSTIAVGVNNLEAGCSGVPRGGESHYVKPYTGSEILITLFGDAFSPTHLHPPAYLFTTAIYPHMHTHTQMRSPPTLPNTLFQIAFVCMCLADPSESRRVLTRAWVVFASKGQHDPNASGSLSIPAYSEGGPMGMTTQDSRDPAISNRLNALFMVDTAALMQDLCSVKEDRAKLKVHNYIMEKELRAIQLSHQRHCLLESTLRSQLNALQIDRNLQMLKASDRSGIPNPLAQQIESMQSAFESLRKGAEHHQTQSEELVNDLKQANAALITAFEKAKSKYLARIRKLESQILAPSSTLMVSRPASSTAFAPTKHTISTQPPMVPAHKAAHPEPPLPPLSPSPASDVYEVIQDSHVGPVTIRKNPGQPLLNATTSGDATSQNSCYSLVRTRTGSADDNTTQPGRFPPSSPSILPSCSATTVPAV